MSLGRMDKPIIVPKNTVVLDNFDHWKSGFGDERIKNLEELKNFVEQLIPGVKEILYRPL